MEIKILNLSCKTDDPETIVGKELIFHEASQSPKIVGTITKIEDGDIYAEITDERLIEALRAPVTISMELNITPNKKFATLWSQRINHRLRGLNI